MDDDFEELLCEDELLPGLSQESLTYAATNLSFVEHDRHDSVYDASQDQDEYAYHRSCLPRALAGEVQDAPVSCTAEPGPDATSYPKYTSSPDRGMFVH